MNGWKFKKKNCCKNGICNSLIKQCLIGIGHFLHKKTGNHIFSTDFRSFSASTRGRGRPVDDPAKPERRPSRKARPNLSKPDGLRIKKADGA